MKLEARRSKIYFILSCYLHNSRKWTNYQVLAHQPSNGDNSESFIRSFSGSCLQWVVAGSRESSWQRFFSLAHVPLTKLHAWNLYLPRVDRIPDVSREGARAVCVNAIEICRCEPPARETRKMIINLPPCLFSNV